MHSFFSPANAVYELALGLTCLAILFGGVISIPFITSAILGSKEDAERRNN